MIVLKKIVIIILTFGFLNCNTQKVYRLGMTPRHIKGKNYYIKDIENHHDKVIGVWRWKNGNDSFEMTLQEFEKFSYPSYFTRKSDQVYGKYKYIKNGEIIAETKTIRPTPKYSLTFIYRSPSRFAVLIFDVKSKTSKKGIFILTSPTTATLELQDKIGGVRIDLGKGTGLDFALPMSLVLTKQ